MDPQVSVYRYNIAFQKNKKFAYCYHDLHGSLHFSQIGLEKSYEILCKTFDSEAKSKLEVCGCILIGVA